MTESFVVKSSGDAGFDGCVADAVRSFVHPTATTPTRVAQYPFKFGVVRDGGT